MKTTDFCRDMAMEGAGAGTWVEFALQCEIDGSGSRIVSTGSAECDGWREDAALRQQYEEGCHEKVLQNGE
jgi:hypothetical protein